MNTNYMVNLDIFFEEEKLFRINEFEIERYVNFFNNSYLDNLEHARFVLNKYPRWAIISGYYAMHDIAKLFLAKEYGLKLGYFDVHLTTIKVLSEILEDEKIVEIIQESYDDYIDLSEDLNKAKKLRAKTQYYTGSDFSKLEFEKKAREFVELKVCLFIKKIKALMEVEE